MFDKLSKNLNMLMAESYINAEELSRRVGVPASNIKKIRNNKNLNPTLSTLAPIAEYFCISISQLIGDEPLPKERIKGSYKFDSSKLRFVPIIPWEEVTKWCENSSNRNSAKNPCIATEHSYSKNAYALVVTEEDWENLAKDTALLVDPEVKPEHRDFIIVYKEGQKAPSLKQILFDENLTYLKPVTLGYKMITLMEDHKIFGVVMEYKKHLKSVDV